MVQELRGCAILEVLSLVPSTPDRQLAVAHQERGYTTPLASVGMWTDMHQYTQLTMIIIHLYKDL